jgi:hypothetical protein
MIKRAVDMALEGHALFVELAQARERHDLEAAAVGQDRPLPADKIVQSAEPRNTLGARTQHQMIGIAEDDVGAKIPHLIEIHGLDRANGSDRHEGRRADRSARRQDLAAARFTIRRE